VSETNESSPSTKAATCCDGGLCRDDWHRHPIRLTEFLLVALVIQVMDILLTMRVEIIGENLRTTEKVLKIAGDSSDVLFVVLLIALVIAMVHHRLTVARESNSRVILFILVAYLAIASLNVGVNMITLVVVQNLSNVSQNGLIIDLGFLFASNMLLFSLWYQLADAYLKGGAFDFSPNEAHPDDPPKWVDYLFLSFNTQATFGPTLEGLRTRPAKVIMMLQTSLSLIVLIVLVARIITAPN